MFLKIWLELYFKIQFDEMLEGTLLWSSIQGE